MIEITVARKVFIQIFTYHILPLSSVYFLHILHIFTSVVNLEAARMSNKCFFVLGGIKLCMPQVFEDVF